MTTNTELKLKIERSLARGNLPTGWIIELKRREENFWTSMDSLFQKWRDEKK